MPSNTLSRTLNDVGLAAWFGGTLANAVALNPAAGEADSPARVGSVAYRVLCASPVPVLAVPHEAREGSSLSFLMRVP